MQETLENQSPETSVRGSRPRSSRPSPPVVFGQSGIAMAFYKSGALADIVVILGVLGIFYGIIQAGREWTGILRPTVLIDLSFRALPRYTFFSLIRGLAAYGISLLFTIILCLLGRKGPASGKTPRSDPWIFSRAFLSWGSCRVWYWP